jgi:uncharacterized membrane protein
MALPSVRGFGGCRLIPIQDDYNPDRMEVIIPVIGIIDG